MPLPAQRTTEINDLIGNPPSWLLRSGIMMVAIVTGIILTGAYFFNYPDKLSGSGTLTSATPPIEIISRATGYIDKIHIAEDEFVNKGDAILYISFRYACVSCSDIIETDTGVKKIRYCNRESEYDHVENPTL